MTGSPGWASPPVGLCVRCRHARRTVSDRGTTFWRCSLSERDPRFVKYPPLPVLACDGYAAGGDEPHAAGSTHPPPG